MLWASSFVNNWVTVRLPKGASTEEVKRWREECRMWEKDKDERIARGREPAPPPRKYVVLKIPEPLTSCSKACPKGKQRTVTCI